MNSLPPDLRLVPFTAADFSRFLPEILAGEAVYPEALRETEESLREAMGRDRAFGAVLFEKGAYAGNLIGFALEADPHRDLLIDRFRPLDPTVAYLFNIAILPEFQGRGHGRRLLDEAVRLAREMGFSTLGGHFRGNASLHNFLAIGGRELGRIDDWFGTGETFAYAELPLDGSGV